MDNIHIGVTLFSKSGALLSANEHARHLLIEGTNFSGDNDIYINQLIEIGGQNFDEILLEDIAAPAYHETNVICQGKLSIPIMFAVSKVRVMDKEVYLIHISLYQTHPCIQDYLISSTCIFEFMSFELLYIRPVKSSDTLYIKSKLTQTPLYLAALANQVRVANVLLLVVLM